MGTKFKGVPENSVIKINIKKKKSEAKKIHDEHSVKILSKARIKQDQN